MNFRTASKRFGKTPIERLSVRFRHDHSNAACVDIKTQKSYFGHTTNSFRMRLYAAGLAYSQRYPRHCGVGRPILTEGSRKYDPLYAACSVG